MTSAPRTAGSPHTDVRVSSQGRQGSGRGSLGQENIFGTAKSLDDANYLAV